MSPLLHIDRAVKRYPGVTALEEVSVDVDGGEIVALVGENGAGKSTLMHILAGALRADEGTIVLEGTPVDIPSPADARRLGIGVIHQDLRLVPELSVAENILLGREPLQGPFRMLDRIAMREQAGAALHMMESTLPLDIPVAALSHAQQQLVAIARTLAGRPKILALDEPTASLSTHETAALFDLLRRLRSAGTGIIYISHRLEEVFALADRIVVLRDGKVAGSGRVSDFDRKALIALMVGRDIGMEYPAPGAATDHEVLRLDRVSGNGIRDVSLVLHAGEILGLAGLVGAGRSELAHLVFGATPLSSGSMTLHGSPYRPGSPADAIASGLGLLTEDRNRLGLVLNMNIRENMTLATLRAFVTGGLLDRGAERQAAARMRERLRIKTPTIENTVASLSGGNRQKVVLGRWLMSDARVLIFDEPTSGIDVGARRETYDMIHELAQRGLAILVISSDLPELLGLCHRISVMSDGSLTGSLDRDTATQERIMELAMPRGDTHR